MHYHEIISAFGPSLYLNTVEILCGLTGLVLMLCVLLPQGARAVVSQSLFIISILIAGAWALWQGEHNGEWLAGHFSHAGPEYFLKAVFLFAGLVFGIWAPHGFKASVYQKHGTEILSLAAFMLCGLSVMVSVRHFVTLFIAMELSSLSAALLVGLSYEKHSAESSLKYFLSAASTAALYWVGVSVVYTQTHTLFFAYPNGAEATVMIVGVALMLLAFWFKMALWPMHAWIPDVYQGIPPVLAALLSLTHAPAMLWALSKYFWVLPISWHHWLAIPSIISMIAGSMLALRQTDAMRMMAYSGVVHSGLWAAAALSYSPQGLGGLLGYLILYAEANTTMFFVIEMMRRRSGTTNMTQWTKTPGGPWLAIPAGIAAVALAGLPPAGTFWAKLGMLIGMWDAYLDDHSLLWIGALSAGVISTIPAFVCYLILAKYVGMKPTEGNILLTYRVSEKMILFLLSILAIGSFVAYGLLQDLPGSMMTR